MNINSKFTGSGGSIKFINIRFFISRTKKKFVPTQAPSLWNIQDVKVRQFFIQKTSQ